VIQQWDFPVDEPVSLPAYRRRRVDATVAYIAERIRTGTSIRALTDELRYGRRQTCMTTGEQAECSMLCQLADCLKSADSVRQTP
jgi:hypothetical protein